MTLKGVSACVGIMCLLTTASLPCAVRAAGPTPSPPTEAAPLRFADISVAQDVRSPETLLAWANDGVRAGLAVAKVDAADVVDRRLVVSVAGKMLAYQVSVGVRGKDGWFAGPTETRCKCDADALVKHIESEVGAVASLLAPPPATAVVGPTPRQAGPGNEGTQPPDAASKTRMSKGGRVGVGLLVAGGLATVAGVVLVALPPRWRDDDSDPEDRVGKTYRLPGGIVLGLGVPAAVVGAVLLGRDRAKRRIAVTPSAGRKSAGVSAVVRF